MPLQRLLALIVMSLGLVVPGDLTFRVCLCNGLFGPTSMHARASVEETNCCEERRDEKSDEPQACTNHENCRCVMVSMPQQPAYSVVSTGPTAAAVPPRPVAWVIQPIEPDAPRSTYTRSRAHAPPLERSNLPLRI